MSEGKADQGEQYSVWAVAKFLLRRKSFIHLSLGAGLASFTAYAVLSFFPSFLERYFFVCGLLRDGDDFQRITEAYLHQAHAMGCVHVEFHVSSSYHIVEQGSDWTEILGGIVAGCDQAEADLGIDGKGDALCLGGRGRKACEGGAGQKNTKKGGSQRAASVI